MSGFAFQKLNNGQTTAKKQLEELEQINQDLDEVNENLEKVVTAVEILGASIDKPEIWKLANMYAPDMELTPIQFCWEPWAGNGNWQVFNDGNLYYGELQIQLRVDNLDANSGRHGAELQVVSNGVRQGRFVAMYKGDNGIDMSSETYVFRGFFTDLIFFKHHSYDFIAQGMFEFQGFKVGEKSVEIPVIDADFKAIVEGYDGTYLLTAASFDENNVRVDNIDLINGNNVVYNRISHIYSKNEFTAYYGNNNPLEVYMQPFGAWVCQLPEKPITKDFYIFFGDHVPPYPEETIQFRIITGEGVNVTYKYYKGEVLHVIRTLEGNTTGHINGYDGGNILLTPNVENLTYFIYDIDGIQIGGVNPLISGENSILIPPNGAGLSINVFVPEP